MEASPLALKTAEFAGHDVGFMEEPLGSNDGPHIRPYLLYTGIKPGDPYCASACSFWVHLAAGALDVTPTFRKSASALGLWANNPTLHIAVADLTPADLPVVAIYDHGGGKGHATLVVGWDATGTGLFQTIDPNSNPQGGREGTGVWALGIRSIHDPQLKGLLRIA